MVSQLACHLSDKLPWETWTSRNFADFQNQILWMVNTFLALQFQTSAPSGLY